MAKPRLVKKQKRARSSRCAEDGSGAFSYVREAGSALSWSFPAPDKAPGAQL